MTGILNALLGTAIPSGRAIGSPYEGGFYGGQISTAGNGIADFNLVVAPNSGGFISSRVWQNPTSSVANTSSVIDGPTNTANLPSASLKSWIDSVNGSNLSGYNDWYIPAKNELEVLYYNLKIDSTANSTTSGANTNAVPSRASNYTTTDPGQTSATDFRSGGAQAFSTPTAFWSSTQAASSTAWGQRFTDGRQLAEDKRNGRNARAIRRVAV